MPDPLTLIELLRAGTRAHHDRVEAVGFGNVLMDGTIDLDRYRRLIAAQADVHAHWNRNCCHSASPFPVRPKRCPTTISPAARPSTAI